MKINNIEFDIKNVSVSKTYNNYNTFRIPRPYDEIRIDATTSNKSLFALDNWINKTRKTENLIAAKDYKHDAIYNSVQIYGVFPIDYTFNQHNIDVTFSVDYISCDLELFNKQILRKEKLKEIEKKI